MSTPMTTIEQAIASDKFSHSRVRSWCGTNIVYIYHYDGTSPTGVHLACGADDTPETDALLRKYHRTSPLSPTERR